jgi:hypothetical protein
MLEPRLGLTDSPDAHYTETSAEAADQLAAARDSASQQLVRAYDGLLTGVAEYDAATVLSQAAHTAAPALSMGAIDSAESIPDRQYLRLFPIRHREQARIIAREKSSMTSIRRFRTFRHQPSSQPQQKPQMKKWRSEHAVAEIAVLQVGSSTFAVRSWSRLNAAPWSTFHAGSQSGPCEPVYSPSILSKFSLIPSNDLNPRSKVTSS